MTLATIYAAHDGQTILGYGRTELDAINDALCARPRDDNGDGLMTARITRALLEQIERGNMRDYVALPDGRLGTPDQFRD
jgi:hypothetical protein